MGGDRSYVYAILCTVLLTATHSSNRLCSQMVTSFLSLMMNVSVARIFSSRVASAKKPAEYTSSSFQNVMKCDVDIRVNLYIPAMLPGGTTVFQRGFKEHDK